MAAHAAGGVVLGEPVGGQNERKPGSMRRSVGIVRTLFAVRSRIRLLPIKRILHQRLKRLVVRGERPVFQTASYIEPAQAVGMKCEWPGSAQSLRSLSFVNIGGGVWRHRLLIIRIIEPRPFLLFRIPPDQLLALTPGLAIRAGRCTVVDDAAIVWPGKAPSVPKQILGIAFERAVVAFLWKHAAVNPGATGCRSVVLQIFDVCQVLAIGDGVPVDLLQDLFIAGFSVFAVRGVVPGKNSQALIAGTTITLRLTLEPQAEVIHEPQFAARVTGRIDSLLAVLQQALGIRECSFFLRRTRRRKQEHFTVNR